MYLEIASISHRFDISLGSAAPLIQAKNYRINPTRELIYINDQFLGRLHCFQLIKRDAMAHLPRMGEMEPRTSKAPPLRRCGMSALMSGCVSWSDKTCATARVW